MSGEKKIIIAGVVILIFGVGKAALDKKPLDSPFIGGLAFILLLSLVSALSEAASNLAGDFAILGMITVLLVDGPAVLQEIPTIQKASAAPTKTTTAPGTGVQ
jgi:hypothetical protein